MPDLAVIVPARNEARAHRALPARPARPRLSDRTDSEIIVVDDNSTDGTAAVVERVAAGGRAGSADSRPAAAAGLGGQAARLPARRRRRRGRLALFPRRRHVAACPGLLRTAVARPLENDGSICCRWNRSRNSAASPERLIIPSGMFLIAFTQDPSRVNDPACPDATANGQFLLFRREVYEAVGGFAAVREEICEDKALARAVKGAGLPPGAPGRRGIGARADVHRVPVAGGGAVEKHRRYGRRRWGDVGRGRPGAGPGLGADHRAAVESAAAVRRRLGFAALALPWPARWRLLGTHLAGARHFRIPFWYGFLFPLGYTLAAAVALYAVCAAPPRRRGLEGPGLHAGGQTSLLVIASEAAMTPGARTADPPTAGSERPR